MKTSWRIKVATVSEFETDACKDHTRLISSGRTGA